MPDLTPTDPVPSEPQPLTVDEVDHWREVVFLSPMRQGFLATTDDTERFIINIDAKDAEIARLTKERDRAWGHLPGKCDCPLCALAAAEEKVAALEAMSDQQNFGAGIEGGLAAEPISDARLERRRIKYEGQDNAWTQAIARIEAAEAQVAALEQLIKRHDIDTRIDAMSQANHRAEAAESKLSIAVAALERLKRVESFAGYAVWVKSVARASLAEIKGGDDAG